MGIVVRVKKFGRVQNVLHLLNVFLLVPGLTVIILELQDALPHAAIAALNRDGVMLQAIGEVLNA